MTILWKLIIGMLIMGLYFGAYPARGDTTKIRFSTVPFIGEAPAYVAYQKKFFHEAGLDVSLKFNKAGFQSLQDLFDGKADIATVAQTPVVYSSFIRNDFYIAGSVEHSNKIDLILARRDHGIKAASDLKGKTIAIFQKTTSDFLM